MNQMVNNKNKNNNNSSNSLVFGLWPQTKIRLEEYLLLHMKVAVARQTELVLSWWKPKIDDSQHGTLNRSLIAQIHLWKKKSIITFLCLTMTHFRMSGLAKEKRVRLKLNSGLINDLQNG